MNRLVVKLQSNWITNSKDCFSQLSTMLYNDTGQSGHSQLSITVTSPISKAMLTDFAVHIHHAFIHSDTFIFRQQIRRQQRPTAKATTNYDSC